MTSKVSSHRLLKILAWCVLAFAFGMAAYRAKTQTIAHDEALEYEWFLDGGVALEQFDSLSGFTRGHIRRIRLSPYLAYASPEQARRFVSVVDPAGSVTYQGNDIVEKSLLVLRSYAPLQVYDFSAFVSEHRKFLLYSRGGPFDWWPTRLIREGYSLRTVVAEQNVKVYFVDTGDNSRPER